MELSKSAELVPLVSSEAREASSKRLFGSYSTWKVEASNGGSFSCSLRKYRWENISVAVGAETGSEEAVFVVEPAVFRP